MSYNNTLKNYVLGKHANRPDLPETTWNCDDMFNSNQHGLICGSSGAGKTTLLLDIVKYLNSLNKHIFVFDLKGDIIIKDDNGNKIGNYLNFTSWGNEYGVSIFDIITGVTEDRLKEIIENNLTPTDDDLFKIRNSGPKVQVERIIEIFKKSYFPNMGPVQKDMLNFLLSDTYKSKEIIFNDYTTWLNKMPTLENTLELIEVINKHNGTITTLDDPLSDEFIESIKPKIVSTKLLKERLLEDDEDKEKIEKLINENESFLREAYTNYCNEASSNYTEESILRSETIKWFKKYKIDYSQYESKEAIRTIAKLSSYIKAIVQSGVFNDKKPPVKKGLNIINLSGLDVSVQRFLVDIWIGRVFNACKIRGEYKNREDKSRGEIVDTYTVFDETKLLSGNQSEKNNPYSYLNRIATEARSIGFGLLVASQSASHFPPEFLKNFFLQIVLKTEASDADTVKKSFGINKELLEFTRLDWGNALIKLNKNFVKVKMNIHNKIRVNSK